MTKRIPKFPNFRPITISDGPFFEELFQEFPPSISEYTFTNLFAWMHSYNFQVSNYKQAYLIISKNKENTSLQSPIGEYTKKDIIDILKQASQSKLTNFFHRSNQQLVDTVNNNSSELEIIPEPAHFDYIYSREDLVTLKGRKFHDKKNLLNQFEKRYDACFEPLTTKNAAEAIEFEHNWCLNRKCEKDSSLAKESCTIFQMLTHFEALNLNGAIVRYKGKIIGLTMGEPLNKDTYVIHAEKGNYHYRGIYQFINQCFAQSIPEKYIWINREQDLGIPGLRKAKKSYNPVHLEKKYTIKLRK